MSSSLNPLTENMLYMPLEFRGEMNVTKFMINKI